jgi:hypothetical protein
MNARDNPGERRIRQKIPLSIQKFPINKKSKLPEVISRQQGKDRSHPLFISIRTAALYLHNLSCSLREKTGKEAADRAGVGGAALR